MTELKHCRDCGQDLPRDQFYSDSRYRDSLGTYCKECKRRQNREITARSAERDRQDPSRKERRRERLRRWRGDNPEKEREKNRRWREAHAEQHLESARQSNRRLRDTVLAHYGQLCACCGSTASLGIDHINGDGGKHRLEVFGKIERGAGGEFYRWLIRNGFPEGFQVLCQPCNSSKGNGVACQLKHDRQPENN